MTKTKKIVLTVSCTLFAVVLTVCAVFGVRWYNDKKAAEEQYRIIMQYYNDKVSAFETENLTIGEKDVVFLGDSLTDGCNLSEYYPEYDALNRGIGGDTSFGLLDRIKISAYDVTAKAVVLLIGGNDILGGKSLESVYQNYEKIINGIKENMPSAKIVWCSLTALGEGWAKNNDKFFICNQKIKLMADKYGCEFVDLFTPLCDEQTGEIVKEYTVEGVHFTHEGYLVVSAEIKAALSKVLG